MDRRHFLTSAAMAAAAVAGVAGYSGFVEPFWLDVTHRDLPIASLPSALDGRTLLHLSDLHIGPSVNDDYLGRVWRAGTALAPDIVAYTGDWVTWRGAAQLRQLEQHLPHVPRGRMLTLSVLGNHDYGAGWSNVHVSNAIADSVRRAGIVVLRNESLDVGGLLVAGIDDFWSPMARPERALARWSRGTPTLVLNHNPDCLDQRDRWRGYDGWILAGHTHGGQCRSPFLDPLILPVRNRRYTSGEIAVGDGRTVYISRGVGYTMQVRFNVRPEITLFTLRRAS